MGSDPQVQVSLPSLTGSVTVGKVLILSGFYFLLCEIKFKNIHIKVYGKS